MVLAYEFVFASDDAFFNQPEINIGVTPGWGGSCRLPRMIGPVRAQRRIITGDRGAAQALQDGFLDCVVAPADPRKEAVDLGTTLSRKWAGALAAAKHLVNHTTDPSRLPGLEHEPKRWGHLFETAGQQEEMHVFLEKRPAAFSTERNSSRGKPPFPWEAPAKPRRDLPLRRTSTNARRGKSGQGRSRRNQPAECYLGRPRS